MKFEIISAEEYEAIKRQAEIARIEGIEKRERQKLAELLLKYGDNSTSEAED